MDMRFCWIRDRCNKGNSTLRGARALSTKPTVSANTILLRVTATCDLHVCTNCPLATATALTVCAMTWRRR
jgi:hypothetical protein